MPKNPLDLNAALAELRLETAPDETRARIRRTVVRPDRPRRSMRALAVAGALGLLLLPVALRRREGSAQALTLAEVARASQTAPYVISRNYSVGPGGKVTLQDEQLWGPKRRVERWFFSPRSLREIRHLPGLTFERDLGSSADGFRSYETLARTSERPKGTDAVGDILGFDFIYKAYSEGYRLVPLGDASPPGVRRYLLQSRTSGKPGAGTWTVEWPSRRILRMETQDGGTRLVTDFEYPARISEERIGVPPVGWTWPDDFRHLAFPDPGPLPRYDLDAERAEFRRLSRVGVRHATIGEISVKLVGAFQCRIVPGMPIFVVYQAGDPGGDREHPARIAGLPAVGGLTTMRGAAPKIMATVFPTGPARGGRVLRSLVARIPVYRRPGEFVGYAEFGSVPVRQCSRELYSGLRDPSFH